ncbi:(2Fe-2S)-binding protein [Umezawaea sp. Da 62-37]|uniref:(2Fe-2S)-binding protein n=1 Tax=Umezawaea sp. Da 62-37 TaxID=3075927 RepID=UPI0028F6ED4C|nr:(2Fe-2S)-binding protein [Umezawaea sp. Da 62-37]WNV88683.1 (2Fe-2S)-binding protein [Umezawaea sp. Da 62-37]
MSDYAAVLATLRRARVISPFFVLDVGRPDDTWLPGTALTDGSRALPDTLDAIGARYRTTERRVAASLFFLSYTARLLCPTVAAHVLDGAIPDIRPGNLWWRYDPEQGLRVRLDEPTTGPGIAEAMAPVVDAVRAESGVAAGLLWGNAASSMAGGLRTMAGTGTASPEECLATAAELFADKPFRQAGGFVDFPGEVAFRRSSCCLYYRLDGGGTCGDCPLSPR